MCGLFLLNKCVCLNNIVILHSAYYICWGWNNIFMEWSVAADKFYNNTARLLSPQWLHDLQSAFGGEGKFIL